MTLQITEQLNGAVNKILQNVLVLCAQLSDWDVVFFLFLVVQMSWRIRSLRQCPELWKYIKLPKPILAFATSWIVGFVNEQIICISKQNPLYLPQCRNKGYGSPSDLECFQDWLWPSPWCGF